MHPAFSVIFLTTLIGAGQGLFLALVLGQAYGALTGQPVAPGFLAGGAVIALVLLGLGLFASFFHLGHPERAWRAVARWRTSWLSREVIALPAFMFVVFLYALGNWLGWSMETLAWIALVGVVLDFTLFVCTGMIYACIKFLREWATPLTVVNFIVLGSASGFTLAAAIAPLGAPALTQPYATLALLLTFLGFITRSASLARNARLKPKSTLQSAIGVRHPKITQRSMGFMGGSFNTREFFHGASRLVMAQIRVVFILGAFILPLTFLALGLTTGKAGWFTLAIIVQYGGLVAERWFFFAQANHPQNLYYQTVG